MARQDMNPGGGATQREIGLVTPEETIIPKAELGVVTNMLNSDIFARLQQRKTNRLQDNSFGFHWTAYANPTEQATRLSCTTGENELMVESLIIRSGGITFQDGTVNLKFPSVTWYRADREPAEDTLGAVIRASEILGNVFRIQSPKTDAYTAGLKPVTGIEKIGFTPDELKLLALHALGNPDKQIAAMIGENLYFVKNTLARARKRAATNDVTHAVVKAIRSGELPL